MVLIIAAVGSSGSGKTTTLEYLIERFSEEGYTVGAIKHIHHKDFTIDKEGTNTWRFAQAGSKVVVAISPQEIDIIKKTQNELKDLNKILALLEKERLDIIIIEGFHSQIAKRTDIPKIITAKDPMDLERTLKDTKTPIIAITGKITENNPQLTYNEIPAINVREKGDKLIQIIRELLEKQMLTKGKAND